MKNPTKTPTKKSHWLRNSSIAGAVLLVVLLVGWIYLENTKAYALGDTNKLEYIGKVDYGCWWVCDANPASTYYYATDLEPGGVAGLFVKARLYRPIEKDLGFTRVWLDRNDDNFILSYYSSMSDVPMRSRLRNTSKHVISIPSFNYQKAVNSL